MKEASRIGLDRVNTSTLNEYSIYLLYLVKLRNQKLDLVLKKGSKMLAGQEK